MTHSVRIPPILTVDWTQIDQPTIRLSLAQAAHGGYIVWDQHCRYYVLAPSSLAFCLRFMQAMEAKGDAVIDDASIERATWHSVQVGTLSERDEHGVAAESQSLGGRAQKASDDPSRAPVLKASRSESVPDEPPDNVRPIRLAR